MSDGLGGQEDPVNAKWALVAAGTEPTMGTAVGSVLASLKSSLAGFRDPPSSALHVFFPAKKKVPSEVLLFLGGAHLKLGVCTRRLLSPMPAQPGVGTGMDLSLFQQGREAPTRMAHAKNGPIQQIIHQESCRAQISH